jgi:GntR family transcriptional regulator
MRKISQHGPVPKYFQLREILLDLIEGLEPESPVPSERELVERYGLARMTVRQAIDSLVTEGRLFKVQGRGTFVAKPKMDLQIRLTSYTEDIRGRGMVPASRALNFGRIDATSHLARELEISPGDPVVRLDRLRLADGTPMARERTYLPESQVPGLLDADPPVSLHQHLAERYGLAPTWGEQMIEAGVADREDAALLEIPPPGVVLRIARRTYVGDVALAYAVCLYRADRYQLWAPLERPARPIVNPRIARNPIAREATHDRSGA